MNSTFIMKFALAAALLAMSGCPLYQSQKEKVEQEATDAMISGALTHVLSNRLQQESALLHLNMKFTDMNGQAVGGGRVAFYSADPESGFKQEKLSELLVNAAGAANVTLTKEALVQNRLNIKIETSCSGYHGYHFYIKYPQSFDTGAWTGSNTINVTLIMLPENYYNGNDLANAYPDTGNLVLQKVNQVPFAASDAVRINDQSVPISSSAATPTRTLFIFDKAGGDFSSNGYVDFAVSPSGELKAEYNGTTMTMRAINNINNTFLFWLIHE